MKSDITIPLGNPKHSVWDEYVPIITNKNETHVYLTDVIEVAPNYNELCFKLDTASPAEIFHIHINTPGGIIDAALMLIHSIKNSKAVVIGHLSGTVASAGTIIALACDELSVAPHTAFMIHNYSGGVFGKGNELKAHQEFVDKNLNDAFRSFYEGFLTPKEMQSVIDGKDLWMNKSEVESRLADRELYRQSGANLVSDSTPSRPKRGRPKKGS